MSVQLCDLREPFKTYFNKLLSFDVKSRGNKILMGDSFFDSIGLPELDPEDAQELAAKLREAIMPIMREFTEKKLEMVHAMMNGAPPVKDIMEGRLL